MKKLIALVLSLLMVLCSVAALAETEAATESKGTLIMATNASFPPYEFYEGTTIVGIDVDYEVVREGMLMVAVSGTAVRI